jgi:hypothetical protein
MMINAMMSALIINALISNAMISRATISGATIIKSSFMNVDHRGYERRQRRCSSESPRGFSSEIVDAICPRVAAPTISLASAATRITAMIIVAPIIEAMITVMIITSMITADTHHGDELPGLIVSADAHRAGRARARSPPP